eukprot:s3847_g2.t1
MHAWRRSGSPAAPTPEALFGPVDLPGDTAVMLIAFGSIGGVTIGISPEAFPTLDAASKTPPSPVRSFGRGPVALNSLIQLALLEMAKSLIQLALLEVVNSLIQLALLEGYSGLRHLGIRRNSSRSSLSGLLLAGSSRVVCSLGLKGLPQGLFQWLFQWASASPWVVVSMAVVMVLGSEVVVVAWIVVVVASSLVVDGWEDVARWVAVVWGPWRQLPLIFPHWSHQWSWECPKSDRVVGGCGLSSSPQ